MINNQDVPIMKKKRVMAIGIDSPATKYIISDNMTIAAEANIPILVVVLVGTAVQR